MRLIIFVTFLLEVGVFGTAWRQATAKATVTSGFVTSIAVTDGGAGYTNAPLVSISGGGGSGATAVATISGDRVSAIRVTSAGIGYTTEPSVAVSAPPRTDILVLPDKKLTSVPLGFWKILASNSTNATRTFQAQGGRGFILKKDTNTVVRSNRRMDQSVAFVSAGGDRVVFTARVLNPIIGRKHVLTVYTFDFAQQVEVTPEKRVFNLKLTNRSGQTVEFYNGGLDPSEWVDRPYGFFTAPVGVSFPGEVIGEEAFEVTDIFVQAEGGAFQPARSFPGGVYYYGNGLIPNVVAPAVGPAVIANPGSTLSFYSAYTGTQTSSSPDVLVSFDGSEPRFPLTTRNFLVETNTVIRAKPFISGYGGPLDEYRFEITGPFLTTEASGKGVVLRNPYVWKVGAPHSLVSIEAIPEIGWRFVRWEGSLTTQVRTATLELDSPKFVRAIFVPDDTIATGEIRIISTRVAQTPPSFAFGLVAPTTSDVQIQTSENLKDWQPWIAIRPTQPITILSDPSFGTSRQRFYRATKP